MNALISFESTFIPQSGNVRGGFWYGFMNVAGKYSAKNLGHGVLAPISFCISVYRAFTLFPAVVVIMSWPLDDEEASHG